MYGSMVTIGLRVGGSEGFKGLRVYHFFKRGQCRAYSALRDGAN